MEENKKLEKLLEKLKKLHEEGPDHPREYPVGHFSMFAELRPMVTELIYRFYEMEFKDIGKEIDVHDYNFRQLANKLDQYYFGKRKHKDD